MIRRLKAKTRRLGLCIQVEKLQRQPHSPIESYGRLEILPYVTEDKVMQRPAGWGRLLLPSIGRVLSSDVTHLPIPPMSACDSGETGLMLKMWLWGFCS